MTKPAKKPISTKRSKKPKALPVAIVPANAARPGSKAYLIHELLGRQTGATLKDLAAATAWQDHSVRGFLSGTLKKKHGLVVTSQIVDGVRYYRIASGNVGQ